ncbi:Vacuolar ATPase assembly integral membrane protein VMA21 [Pleurotus pulmonarius]
MSEQKAVATVNRQIAAGSGTLVKLGIFSIALGVVPITSYFGSLHYVWEGNATYAAITAVVAANVVLISYIIASVLEDQTSTTTSTGTGTRSTAVIAESRKER